MVVNRLGRNATVRERADSASSIEKIASNSDCLVNLVNWYLPRLISMHNRIVGESREKRSSDESQSDDLSDQGVRVRALARTFRVNKLECEL